MVSIIVVGLSVAIPFFYGTYTERDQIVSQSTQVFQLSKGEDKNSAEPPVSKEIKVNVKPKKGSSCTTTHTETEDKPIVKGTVTKISYDDGKTWHDVAEIENAKVVEI